MSIAAAFQAAVNGDIAGAISIYRQMIAADYRNPDLHNALGQLFLLNGDFERGWMECERRSAQREMPFPRWHGEEPKGANILIHGEQGFGDNINFVRYTPMVARRGGRVIVFTRQGLERLFATVPGVSEIVVEGQEISNIGFEVPMLSLPHIFSTNLHTIPKQVPYLQADPARVETWRKSLETYAGLKVGLVWSGNTEAPYNSRRSPGLRPFLSLMDCPGIHFFGLQMGGGRADLEGAALPANFTDLGPLLTSFDETAAAMMSLDLVISVCTGPTHLAGALGRPMWVVLSVFPDWRWMLDREDSPWYPTARLFRQGIGEDWVPVFTRLRSALETWAQETRAEAKTT